MKASSLLTTAAMPFPHAGCEGAEEKLTPCMHVDPALAFLRSTVLQDAASRNAMAGQEEVSQSLASAQARIKMLEASLAEAHATVRHPCCLAAQAATCSAC